MRKQLRPDAPEVLQLKADDFNAHWVTLRKENPSAQFTWSRQGKNIREEILPNLRLMTQEHCSFCDAFPLDSRNEQVEHFRPKTDPRFYDLAYSWGNLYLICGTCNGDKRATFDERLLAPDEDTYECSRYFYFDTTTGELKPHPSSSTEDKERAQITITIYSLNTSKRSSLRKHEARSWIRGLSSGESLNINEFAYRDFLESHSTQSQNPKGFLEMMKEC